jgi:hypothetical protein
MKSAPFLRTGPRGKLGNFVSPVQNNTSAAKVLFNNEVFGVTTTTRSKRFFSTISG